MSSTQKTHTSSSAVAQQSEPIGSCQNKNKIRVMLVGNSSDNYSIQRATGTSNDRREKGTQL